MSCELQVENTRNCNHQFYIVKVRPSLEEFKEEEANKKYDLLTSAPHRINKEIEQLEADEEKIERKLSPMYERESYIYSTYYRIKDLEIAEKKLHKNSVPRKTGVIYLTEFDAGNPIRPPMRPDRKRCQKRLINKGRMDMEYLQQVEEQLLSSKEKDGMTSCGTQELNDLMNSMAQRIQHGSKTRKEEMRIHHKLRELKITREMYNAQPEPYRWWRIFEDSQRKEEENTRQYKESLKRRLKNMLFDLEILKKGHKGCDAKMVRLEEKLQCVKEDIISLQKELKEVKSESKNTYHLIQMLARNHKQESCYDEYQSLLAKVAQTVDVAKVKQLCDTQVEGFMARWNDNQAFRDDYQMRRETNA